MGSLHYKGYTGSVEYSEADRCMHGRVLGLKKSLIAYEGTTEKELETDFKEGIDVYLESCAEDGIQPEKPHSVAVRIPAYIHHRIVSYAKKNRTSVSHFVSDAVERQLAMN